MHAPAPLGQTLTINTGSFSLRLICLQVCREGVLLEVQSFIPSLSLQEGVVSLSLHCCYPPPHFFFFFTLSHSVLKISERI